MKTQVISLFARGGGLVLFFTALLGLGYPYLMHIIGITFFPEQTKGSIVLSEKGQAVGSYLIAQDFTEDIYFHPRLSFAGPLGYDASSSSPSYLAPSSENFIDIVSSTCLDFRITNQINSTTPLPADAVTSSASGLDPHISMINARLQAPRVAKARNIPLDEILTILNQQTESSYFTPAPYINVLKVNLVLDKRQGK